MAEAFSAVVSCGFALLAHTASGWLGRKATKIGRARGERRRRPSTALQRFFLQHAYLVGVMSHGGHVEYERHVWTTKSGTVGGLGTAFVAKIVLLVFSVIFSSGSC